MILSKFVDRMAKELPEYSVSINRGEFNVKTSTLDGKWGIFTKVTPKFLKGELHDKYFSIIGRIIRESMRRKDNGSKV